MKKMNSMVLVLGLGATISLQAKLASEMKFFNDTKENITVGLTQDPRQVATGPANNVLVGHISWKANPTEIKPGTNHRFYVESPGGLKGVVQFPKSGKHYTIGMSAPKATYHIKGSHYLDVQESDTMAPVKVRK